MKSLHFQSEDGESMKEHLDMSKQEKLRIISDPRIIVHQKLDDDSSYSSPDFRLVTTIDKEPIGAAFRKGKTWSIVYGSIWVGEYANWEDALINLLVAYYG